MNKTDNKTKLIFIPMISIVMIVAIVFACSSNKSKFETYTFGSYPQSDVTGATKEPIEWLVLDNKDGAKLLLSKYIIDCKPYNNEYTNTTWADCSLRGWLNDEFLNTAFNSDEYNKIEKVTVFNHRNIDFDTDAGSETDDRVFCLSQQEIESYLGLGANGGDDIENGKKIATIGTNFAKAVVNNAVVTNDESDKKLYVNDNSNAWYNGYSGYWLRTPGENQMSATNVGSDGTISKSGANVSFGFIGVRPAIWVKS